MGKVYRMVCRCGRPTVEAVLKDVKIRTEEPPRIRVDVLAGVNLEEEED